MTSDATIRFTRLDPATATALVEAMALAAHADGGLEQAEEAALVSELRAVLAGTPLEAEFGGAVVAGKLAEAREALEREGREARVAALKAALAEPADRKGALALAVRVAAADGVVRTSERELLLELAEGLAIDPDEAADLVREHGRSKLA